MNSNCEIRSWMHIDTQTKSLQPMKTKFNQLVGICILLILCSFRSEKLPKDFKKLLERASLTFIETEGMVETKIISNRQMEYEYAVKYPDKRFEVRYSIRPLDEHLRVYKEKLKNKQEGDVILDPNNYYSSLLQATILNISGGELPEITEFGKKPVKSEFNADWGATAFVEVGKEFGQNYKYCMVVAIHKKNCGDAYFFYLSDEKRNFDQLMRPPFHSLKFK